METKVQIDNVALGAIKYVFLAAVMVVSVWFLQIHFDTSLREDLNRLGVSNCLSGRDNVIKYNDSLQDQILNTEDLLNINQARGDTVRVNANLKAIARLKANKIPLTTIEQCRNPILK